MTEDMRERAEKIVAEIESVVDGSSSLAQQHRDLMGIIGRELAALSSAGTPAGDIGALAKSIVHYVLRTFARSDADHLTVDVAGQLSAFMESRLGGLQALVQQNKEMAESIQEEVSAGTSGTPSAPDRAEELATKLDELLCSWPDIDFGKESLGTYERRRQLASLLRDEMAAAPPREEG